LIHDKAQKIFRLIIVPRMWHITAQPIGTVVSINPFAIFQLKIKRSTKSHQECLIVSADKIDLMPVLVSISWNQICQNP